MLRYAFWDDGTFCPIDQVEDSYPQDFHTKTFESDEDALIYIAAVANTRHIDSIVHRSLFLKRQAC